MEAGDAKLFGGGTAPVNGAPGVAGVAREGAMEVSPRLKAMNKPEAKLPSCLASWNGMAPSKVIPEAHRTGVGLDGFTAPSHGKGGLVKLDFMKKPIAELKGDERNISALARSYHGVGPDAVWNGKDSFHPPEK